MPIIAGIMIHRIKEKIYAETGHQDFAIGERVVVETENGQEVGMVCEREKFVEKAKEPVGTIIRKVTPEDRKRIAENETRAAEAHKTVVMKIEDHELQMKLTCVDFTFDRSKLFIYYTAESRVDFRELIKDLGHMLKARIQMVQIGVRDESRMIGGIGTCGRQLCCQSFLKDFSSVTIDMAKEQDLSLNTAKLSGLCGRLMCCIGYEHAYYREAKKKLPSYGARVTTPHGQGMVTGVNCLTEQVTVSFPDMPSKTVPLADISAVSLERRGGQQPAAQQAPRPPAPAEKPGERPRHQNGPRHGHQPQGRPPEQRPHQPSGQNQGQRPGQGPQRQENDPRRQQQNRHHHHDRNRGQRHDHR